MLEHVLRGVFQKKDHATKTIMTKNSSSPKTLNTIQTSSSIMVPPKNESGCQSPKSPYSGKASRHLSERERDRGTNLVRPLQVPTTTQQIYCEDRANATSPTVPSSNSHSLPSLPELSTMDRQFSPSLSKKRLQLVLDSSPPTNDDSNLLTSYLILTEKTATDLIKEQQSTSHTNNKDLEANLMDYMHHAEYCKLRPVESKQTVILSSAPPKRTRLQ